MLNPRVKEKWIKALLSGDYVQATGTLRKNEKGNKARTRAERNGHCCLGVLSEQICELSAVKNTNWRYSKKHGNWYEVGEPAAEENYSGDIPGDVAHAIGLDDPMDDSDNWIQEALVNMNDKEDKTFKQIASWIKSNL